MPFQVRNFAGLTAFQTNAKVVPFTPLPSSVLVMSVMARNGALFGPANTPAGWTLVQTRDNGSSFGVFVAPGTQTAVPACTSTGDSNTDYSFTEIEQGELSIVTAGGLTGFGATLAPSAVPYVLAAGGRVAAVAVLGGMSGDPASGCKWNDRPGWDKRLCITHLGGAFHPWHAIYTRIYDPCPTPVVDTFTNIVGSNTAGAMILVPAAPSGGGFAGEPGGGVW